MIKEIEKKKEGFISKVKDLAASESVPALAEKARGGKDAATAFAAVFRAFEEALGITPYDSQIEAGAYLDGENIVELATGEGKTAAAVFAAFYSVCKGERVHILTFNDYLARRDRDWMKPVYDLLGVSAEYITEKTELPERRKAYRADVLYSTVKECGFDFLRDFLAFSEAETAAVGYERAIIDEADSLLIDEARIPLVAAGTMEVPLDADLPEIFAFARTLIDGDYEVDKDALTAYLTKSGAEKTEAHYSVTNIYDEENNELLAKLNDCLKALHLLAEDTDYIVRDGAVKIIDIFTGRVAENRSYPGFLQAAVELKHGLPVTERGVIMGSVPIQFFLRQYGRISGMTGTAATARDEFSELYGLSVKHVEPNKPSIRKDLPIAIYYDEESKLNAVVSEIKTANAKKQPVLVGTDSISQSERLSEKLTAAGIAHNVLNAKNDELEAEIIKGAGMPSAVTISTNMAGRGVDIKLGGADEARHDEAEAAGGLYAIGTFLAESARINDQLRGRAARQGDAGQSRLFVSLDEEIMKINKLEKLIPARHYPEPTTDEITDKTVVKEVGRIQRISQGKTLDERVRLLKFTMIGEKHRDITFNARRRCLSGENPPHIWQDNFPILYEEAVGEYGEEAVNKKQTEYLAAVINVQWGKYLEFASSLREGIHLSAIGGKNPAEEYNIGCEEYYGTMEEQITESMGEGLRELMDSGIDGLKVPKPTKITTYLLADSGDELERRTLAQVLLADEIPEGFDEYDDYDEEEYGEEEDEPDAQPEPAEEDAESGEEKKGFFAKLFGKK